MRIFKERCAMLLECEECGTKISDKSPSCVKCGAPVAARRIAENLSKFSTVTRGSIRCVVCGYCGQMGMKKGFFYYLSKIILASVLGSLCLLFVPFTLWSYVIAGLIMGAVLSSVNPFLRYVCPSCSTVLN